MAVVSAGDAATAAPCQKPAADHLPRESMSRARAHRRSRNECGCSGEPLLPCSYCHAPQDPSRPAQPRRTPPEMASGSVLRGSTRPGRALSYILQESLTVSSAGPVVNGPGSGSWISSTRPAAPHARRARAGRADDNPQEGTAGRPTHGLQSSRSGPRPARSIQTPGQSARSTTTRQSGSDFKNIRP